MEQYNFGMFGRKCTTHGMYPGTFICFCPRPYHSSLNPNRDMSCLVELSDGRLGYFKPDTVKFDNHEDAGGDLYRISNIGAVVNALHDHGYSNALIACILGLENTSTLRTLIEKEDEKNG